MSYVSLIVTPLLFWFLIRKSKSESLAIEIKFNIPSTYFLPIVFLMEHLAFLSFFILKKVIPPEGHWLVKQLEEEAYYQSIDRDEEAYK